MNSTRKQMLLIGIKLSQIQSILCQRHINLLDTKYLMSKTQDYNNKRTKYTPKTKYLLVLFKTNVFYLDPDTKYLSVVLKQC